MSEDRLLLIVRIALAAGWGVVALVLLLAAFPNNAVRLPMLTRINVLTVTPEGWAFFTRDAREDGLRVWRLADDGWRRVIDQNSAPRHLFGARRGARIGNMELSHVSASLPVEAWRRCADWAPACADSLQVHTVVDRVLRPTLCGEILIDRRPPVPWAWSAASDETIMPGWAARARVECGAPPSEAS